VPLLLVGLAVIAALYSGKLRLRVPTPARALLIAAAGLLLVLPIFLNWYQADWNRWLKQLPIIGSSSTLLRWFCVYIPAISVISGWAMHRTGWNQPAIATAAIAVLLLSNATTDRGFYRHQPYDPRPLVAAYDEVKAGTRQPAIANIEVVADQNGNIAMPPDRNNSLARGNSQLACYEPTFGYGLEKFPLGLLRPGPVLASVDDVHLNLKNPACYVYPGENSCAPGDPFPNTRRSEAEAFAGYRTFDYRVSTRQSVANAINVVALMAAIAVMTWNLLAWLRRRVGKARTANRT
jgi:hypothetical protein